MRHSASMSEFISKNFEMRYRLFSMSFVVVLDKQYYRVACQIAKRYKHSNTQPCGFVLKYIETDIARCGRTKLAEKRLCFYKDIPWQNIRVRKVTCAPR